MSRRKFPIRDHLTEAEIRIVTELSKEGVSNIELGNILFCTEQTIKFHLTSLYSYSKTKNRTALVLWWIRHGQYECRPEEILPEEDKVSDVIALTADPEDILIEINKVFVPSTDKLDRSNVDDNSDVWPIDDNGESNAR